MKVMKRISLHISTVFLLVLGLQVEVGGEKSESDAVGRMHRLFYLFSLQVPEQCDRACTLQNMVRPYSHQLQVIGVVRAVGSDEEEGVFLEEFRRHHALSYRLMTVAAALDDAEMPPAVKGRFTAPEDYALLLDRDGRLVASGTGQELHRLLGAFAPVSTDVDESTWGKIKELFQ